MKTIFVSSTFRDMHFERDAIREITAPIVNAEAWKHNDTVDFCDLRWGNNTANLDSETGSKKVLEVCLDQIDRSDSPMVVILGYRYGWIPDSELISLAASKKALMISDLECSVTALEIEFGALCDPVKASKTLFYFREIENEPESDYLAEDDFHASKVKALKDRICYATGNRIKTYSVRWNGHGFDGIKEFAEMLAKDIIAFYQSDWRETDGLSPFDLERRAHETFVREKAACFRARHTDAEKLLVIAKAQPITIIKSVLFFCTSVENLLLSPLHFLKMLCFYLD